MSIRSRLGAAWRGLSSKDAGSGDLSPYGALSPFIDVYGSRASKSGQSVTVKTALQNSTAFGALRCIGEGVGQSPCDLFQDRAGGKGKDLAVDDPLYPIFALSPNETQTSFEFFETLVFHAGLTGDFIAFKNTVGIERELRELIPIEPGTWRLKRHPDLTRTYTVRDASGREKDFPQEVIWHVRGPSWNGYSGIEILKSAREAIGLSMAIEADQSDLYKNGLRSTGTYSVEGNLTKDQYKELREFIKDYQANPQGPLLLDRAAKYQRETFSSVDAQTLESRKLQIEEICRIFRVMPIMLGHGGDQSPTFASAEQFFIAHVTHTLLPWCRRIELSIGKNLIGIERWRAGLRAKFNLSALMRGSFADRQNAFGKMLGSGGSPPYAEINEVRELDDMNPVDWGNGKPEPPIAPTAVAKTPAPGA